MDTSVEWIGHEPASLQPGELSVSSECLPFTAIPHTTPLFADYLYDFPKVQQFFARPPHLNSWAADEVKKIAYDDMRRSRVADILERQNRAWGASEATLENIKRLRRGACAIVTGQQVGLFGGPLFSIFKAVSAVSMAAEVTKLGVNCVPVFWLATEDHDLAEVNHTVLLGADGRLHRAETPTHAVENAPMSQVRFGPEITPVVDEAAAIAGDSEITDWIRESYRPGETLGSAFAKLFTKLFEQWGVILLDASDPDLHALVAPIYREALERSSELTGELLNRGKQLERAGYHQQVKVTESSTLLFTIRDGQRLPIHRANSNHGEFRVETEKVGREALLAQIAQAPHRFSANVLLRPVSQDYMLPTLAYIGGPAEIAYFAQAAVVYEKLLGRVTPILPRFSATLVESKARELMQRYRLKFSDVLHGPEHLRELMATHVLPAELQTSFEAADAGLRESLEQITSGLERLDKTLVEAAQRAGAKMHYQLKRLRARAARAQLRREEVISRHAQLISSCLFPDKALQEREISGVSFVARHGRELLARLHQSAQAGCLDHQILYL